MKFEIINTENKTVMNTTDVSCIPEKELLMSMSKSGYKFKIDGKILSVKKIIAQLKGSINE